MNKKIRMIFVLLLIVVAGFFYSYTSDVLALTIGARWSLDESERISSQTITFAGINNVSALVVCNNSTIEMNNVVLDFANDVNVTSSLIEVQSGSTLILNNVTIKTAKTYNVGILNYGTLQLNGLTVIGTINTTIVNDVENVADSLQLYNVKESSPINVSLINGYISVYENTIIDDIVTIDIGSTEYSDDIIGKMLVKGRQTLANFYENKFVLKNTPKVSEFADKQEYLLYMQENNPYYMDYVGDIGDELDESDDGYLITLGDGTSSNLETGDLILTKYMLYLLDSDSVYFSGKYVTADKYVNITDTTYKVNGRVIKNGIEVTSVDGGFYLDNTTAITGHPTNHTLAKMGGTSLMSTPISIKLDVYNNGVKVDALCRQFNVQEFGSRGVFVDIAGFTYENISSSNNLVTIGSVIQNSRFVRPVITCAEGASSATIRVDVQKIAIPTTKVDVVLEKSTFEYSKTNVISDIKPYYMLGSEKVYLDSLEYTVSNSNSEVVASVINADNYTVTLVSEDGTIEFNQNELHFVVNPKVITLDFVNNFTYDGQAKFVTVTPVGLINGDHVNVAYENNGRTVPGSQIVTVSINNANYKLSDDCCSTMLTIAKATIDMSAVMFEDIAVTYDGEEHSILATNVPSLVNVTYDNNSHIDVCNDANGYYIAVAEFAIKSDYIDYYNELSITRLTANLTINRATIDIVNVQFDNINHVYDKNPVSTYVKGNLPQGVASVDYVDNVQTNAGTYTAVARFVLDDDHKNNYQAVPATMTATITIAKATIDLSAFEFEDMTIEFDGEYHQILVKGIDESLITINYVDGAKKEVEVYRQRVVLSLKDSNNYNELAFTQREATLTINRAVIDVSQVQFEDKIVTYDGEVHTVSITNIPDNVQANVKYYLSGKLVENPTNAGTYTATAEFTVPNWYQNSYVPIPNKSVTLKISPIEIDTSMIDFADVTHVYDGTTITLTATGTLPSEVKTIMYENNIQKDYRAEPYQAKAIFVMKPEYEGNYVASPSIMYANITILQAQVDLSKLKFEDKTIEYDGQNHEILLSGINTKHVRVTYLDSSVSEVGEHIQRVTLSLVDSKNYEPLPAEKVNLSATLKIIPAVIDMTGIKFENRTYTYVSGIQRRLEVSGDLGSVSVSYSYYYEDQLINYVPYEAGQYLVCADFEIQGWDDDCYEPIDSMTAILTINQATIDFSNIQLVGQTITYDGQEHSLAVNKTLGNVAYEYVNNSHTEVGEYTVTVNIEYDERNYKLVNYVPLQAKLIITQASIDMSNVKFKDVSYIYDGTEKIVEIEGVLPNFVEIKEYINNSRTYVGTSNAQVLFNVTNSNYMPVSPMSCKLVISPKKLTLTLKENEFTYDGNPKTVEVNVSGLVGSDQVSIQLRNATNTNAGTYNAVVNSIGNENYTVSSSLSLPYEIKKATVNMDGVSLADKTVTYSPGVTHTIEATGVPDNIVVNYNYSVGNNSIDYMPSNAGTYVVTANFAVVGWHAGSYEPIQSLKATLKINPIEIDTSSVVYENIEFTYNGSAVEHKVTGVLPKEILHVEYENNIQSEYRAEPYKAKATFVLKSEYATNYVANPSVLNADIKILQAQVDLSKLEFEDKTVSYDGSDYEIIVKGVNSRQVKVTYLDPARSEVGEYVQRVKLTLADSKNYLPLPDDKVDLTATLKIVPAVIDMSGIRFESKTYTYMYNTTRRLQISGNLNNLSVEYQYYYQGQLIDYYPSEAGAYQVTAEFAVNDWEESNYEPIDSMTATLIINPATINFEYTKLNNQSFVYDGNPHSLVVVNMPSGIAYEYINNSHIDVGNYEVSMTITYDERNYIISGYEPLKAILSITQAKIDMSGVKFQNKTFVYDSEPKTVEISGTLPEFVEVLRYGNNTRTNVGTSNAYVEFVVTNPNYLPVENMSCELVITPKPVSVSLKQNTFVYTGQSISVEVYVTGIIDGEQVELSILNGVNTNAGNYVADVVSLGNDNYYVLSSKHLAYEIKKADIDMSGIAFVDTTYTFDGKSHVPELQGTLPQGLTYTLLNANNLVNVGSYDVVCKFNVTNRNYNIPSELEATLTIEPKPILVEFYNYDGLIEDDQIKSIDVRLVGVINNAFKGYYLSYDKQPQKAGKYVCTLVLKDSNYVIIGSNKISFEILTNYKEYKDQVYDIILEGEGFSSETNVTIVDDQSEDFVMMMNSHDVKKYKTFEIKVDGGVAQDIDVTMSLKTFAVENIKYLKLYKLESGKLKQIDYIIDSGTIKFSAMTNDQIVVLEERDLVERNLVMVYIIVTLAVVILMINISISIVYVMSKKKDK